ncbi:Lactose permease [Candida viswanathii]|uniref:Lactose permease n=1 Tax=Candida viswanathii TaxID=5486 RepID=A0A367XLB6_9ASCO|nr:Lactose permease [Candida viswanathii]
MKNFVPHSSKFLSKSKSDEDKTKATVAHFEDAPSSKSVDDAPAGFIAPEESIDDYLYLDKPFYKYRFMHVLNWYIFLNTLSATTSGYDGSMLNGFQIIDRWGKKMGNPSGAVLGALSNGVVFGGLIAAFFASSFCDRYGRKPTVLLGAFFLILGSILQGASTNYTFFLMSRLIIGVGTGLSAVGSPCLISELAYPKYRDTCTSFYNTFWYLGATIAAWVTFGTHKIPSQYAWKIPSYLQAALPLAQLLCFYWVPESPRYLISRGKIDKATEILRKYHTGNDFSEQATRLVEFEVREISAALELEKLYSNSKYTDFITLPTYRKRLFLVVFTAFFMQLPGNGLVSYYLNKVLDTIGITSASHQLIINGGLMIYNMGVSWFLTLLVRFFRRRTLFLASSLGMCVCYIIWTILSARFAMTNNTDSLLAKGVLAFIFLFYFAYNVGANVLPFLYISEVVPYSHRAKGLNILQVSINIFLIYNGFVNPIAMDAIQWKYYIVYCCILGVEVIVIYFFYVETSGYTLEEVAIVFGDDPKDLQPHLSSASEKPSVEKVETV